MSKQEGPAAANSPGPELSMPVARGKNYLYAIVASGAPHSYPAIGIEGSDVYTITEGQLAAVVSGVVSPKIRPERANLMAHQAVLKRLLADTTPLPTAFGMIATPEAISRILVKNQHALREQTQRVAGKVEMGLRVAWDVPNIFEYFVNTHAELRLSRDLLGGTGRKLTQEVQIELGRMFERLLNEDREKYVQEVESALASVCFEIKANPCHNEHDVMSLACLIDRNKQEEFDMAVFEAAKLFDNYFSFDYNGPWAPYNFVELDLEP